MMPRAMNAIQCFVFNLLLTLTLPSPKGRGGLPSPAKRRGRAGDEGLYFLYQIILAALKSAIQIIVTCANCGNYRHA